MPIMLLLTYFIEIYLINSTFYLDLVIELFPNYHYDPF